MKISEYKEILRNAQTQRRGERSWLRSIFFEDWLMKLVALGIAVALWYGVTGSTVTRRLSDVAFRLNPSTDLEISNAPVEKVTLVVTGDKRRVDRLRETDLTVSLNVSDYAAGEYVAQLTPNNVAVDLPSGVKIESILPSRVPVILEKRDEKFVPVEVDFEGQLPSNLEVYETVVTPSKVRIGGATSQLETVDLLLTEKISLANQNGTFTQKQAAVALSNPKLTLLDSGVDVVVKIGEKRAERTFSGVKVKSADGTKIAPQTASVTIYGVRSAVEKIRSEHLSIVVEKNVEGELAAPRLVIEPNITEEKIEMREIKPQKFEAAH